MKKKVVWIIIVVIVLVSFWRVFLREKKPPVSEVQKTGDFSSDSEKKEDLEQKILSFSIDGRSAKGVNQWHLEGGTAEIVGESIKLQDLSAVAYGDNVTVNLTSDTGMYNKEKGEVELIGNVKVVSDDGAQLMTEKAKWSQTTKEISTEEPVSIKREELTATGIGGMANSDAKTASLLKNVEVRMEPNTTVICEGPLEISQFDNQAVFYNKVMVEDKEGRLFADKLTVEFDPENKQISKVIAEGNVKLKKGNSYTMSERAEYTESTKSAKLSGRPRVIIDPNELEKLDGFGMSDIIDDSSKE